MNNDTKTTISGLVAALAAAAYVGATAAGVSHVFTVACGMVWAAATAFLGYYSNKPNTTPPAQLPK